MDAMERSSSPDPEPVSRKRARDGQDDEHDSDDATEPDELGSDRTQSREPSFGNITAATLRYASHKKLRSEQRDEVEVFLQVSF